MGRPDRVVRPDGRWLQLAPPVFPSTVTPTKGLEPAWESGDQLVSHCDQDQVVKDVSDLQHLGNE